MPRIGVIGIIAFGALIYLLDQVVMIGIQIE